MAAALCGRRALPKKSTDEGRAARKQILEALGVSGLPRLPTHDQNDACIAAVLAAAADGNVPGLTPTGIGSPLFADPDGTLREGLMVIPEVTAKTGELISEVLRKLPTIDVVAADRRTHVESDSCPTNDRANGLLNQFILRALEGNPQVCTYSWAYRQLFNASYRKWSQAYVHQVLAVAQRTPPKELPGLGAVRLDTFVVAKRNGIQVTATGNLLDTRAKIGRGYSERPWFLIDDLETTNALRTDQTRGDSGPKTYGD